MRLKLGLAMSLSLMAAVMLLTGCRAGQSEQRTLRLSLIPTTDPGKIVRESQPLVAYLEKEMGAKIDLTVPTNYAAVVEAIVNDQVDMAYLGGFTYVQASKRAGVLPLVQRERDQNFHTLFITHPGTGINSLADLKGHTFAFGDVNSTSGHLMPEYFMRKANVEPEVIAKAIYTGGHDATALAVANKKVDAGALDETVYQRMVAEGKLNPEQAKVFYTTPPYYDYIWVSRRGLDPSISESFTAAFLKLDANDPTQRKILDLLGATNYVRAEDSNYDKLRQAASDAGLLK